LESCGLVLDVMADGIVLAILESLRMLDWGQSGI
jgi:hypothetical protein